MKLQVDGRAGSVMFGLDVSMTTPAKQRDLTGFLPKIGIKVVFFML